LSREDFDEYERGLRIRRRIALSIVPLVLVLSVIGLIVVQRSDPSVDVRETEHEPNNTPAQANLIGSGRPIRGQIGKRIAVEESDRDFYRLVVDGSGPQVLRAEVSGLPNLEIVLEVFDSAGKKIAEADNGGVGDGEILPNLRLRPGEHYLSVREVWVAGKPATENVSDWYTLTAVVGKLPADRESEPDDRPDQALPIADGETIHGYLSRADDVDYFYVHGEGGGTLSGQLSAIDAVDTRIVVLPAGASAGPPGPLPAGAKIFDAGGPGAAETFAGIAWAAGTPGPLIVIRRNPAHSTGGPRHAPVGLDSEYRLSLHLTP
jgi:hypothetical protein